MLFGVGRIGAGISQRVRIAEPHQGVDVAVGVVAQHVAAIHPQQARDTQQRRQRRQQRPRGGRVVARRAHQAGAGGEQGAFAVDLDVAAFQYPGQGFDLDIGQRVLVGQRAGHGIVELGAVFAAPAVEAKVERYPPAAAQHGQRTVIAYPHVVGGRNRQRQARLRQAGMGQALGDMAAVVFVVAGDDQGFTLGDGCGEAGEFGLCVIQGLGPVRLGVWPGQDDGRLRRPFGRQHTRRKRCHGFGPGWAAPDFFSAWATSGGM